LGNSADSAAVLNALALLQIREARYEEAREVLDRALKILTAAADAVPSDLVKLLHVRASLNSRQAKWRESEQDLERAVSMADEHRDDRASLG
jgi:tetratricopeptide (TPR) repeat protein